LEKGEDNARECRVAMATRREMQFTTALPLA